MTNTTNPQLEPTGTKPTKWKSNWEIELENRLATYDLKDCVKRFFELLSKKETSDAGFEFQPNYISSCRALDGVEFKQLITKMKYFCEISEHQIKCGYPLCKYYVEAAPEMHCPMPIQGSPCQGMGNPYEYYYGIRRIY